VGRSKVNGGVIYELIVWVCGFWEVPALQLICQRLVHLTVREKNIRFEHQTGSC
jgi:hypothetical protein